MWSKEASSPTERKPTNNLEDFFLGMGEPATERALPTPAAPDGDRLAALTERTGIQLV